jgi:hypothetical protein
MMDQRRQAPPLPFGNMRFRVEIEGLPGVGAVEVIFPEARIAARRGKGAAVIYGSLILRRGLTLARDWYEWWDEARREKWPTKRSVRVTLPDGAGTDAMGWLIKDALPVAYSLSPLNALGNEPVIETLELSVGGFQALDSGRASAARPNARRRAAK